MLTDHTEISNWLKKYNITQYIINNDNTVTVNGGVYLKSHNVDSIDVQFKISNGDFNCSGNNLTSLIGCPEIVYGNFDCSENKLTSLKGSPNEVYGDFSCYLNQLQDLIDGPSIAYFYNCSNNVLTSLKGCPDNIKHDFLCSNNLLESLKIAPQKVGINFRCNSNPLRSLQDFTCNFEGEFTHSCYSQIDNPDRPRLIKGFEEHYNDRENSQIKYYILSLSYKELHNILSYNELQDKIPCTNKISKNKTKI